jgi:hypothetical protein
VGLHYGLNKQFGGGAEFFFGLNIGLDGAFAKKDL